MPSIVDKFHSVILTSMKRYPNLYYVKHLILAELNVNEWNTKFELPVWEEADIKELKESLKLPASFRYNDKKHVPSTTYLKEQGIYNLFFPDTPTLEALSLINTLEIRSALEKLILSGEEPQKIAKALNSKFETKLAGTAIERYRHYFWNPKVMKIADWERIYTDKRSERREAINIIKNGPDYTRHLLGFIQSIQIKESLKELVTVLHFDMQELKFQRANGEKTKALATIATTLIKIDEKLSTNDISLKEEFKTFERIQVEHTQADIKSIQELAPAGNYTLSGRELPELAAYTGEKVIEVLDHDYAEK